MLRSFLLALLAAAFLVPNAALADKRVALVIGNGAYQHAEPLPNPPRDANAIADLLKRAGFSVEVHNDLGHSDFKHTLHDFATTAHDADIAVVYYAGHDAQIRNENYLIPIDAKLELGDDIGGQAIALDDVLKTTEGAKRLRLLLLDSNGLAQVDESILSTLGDTLIAYAAAPGSTALDGDGEHSPFAEALLKHLIEPGLDIRRVLEKVRDDVRRGTGGKQEPFFYGVLGGDEFSLVPAAATQPLPAAPKD